MPVWPASSQGPCGSPHAAGGGGGGNTPAPPAANPQACQGLTSVTSDSATVTTATMVSGPITLASAAGSASVSVPFCRVEGVARPSADSEIKFEVWLPATRAAWNGRMKVEAASDSYLGGVPYPRMGQMIAQGWVEAGSNLGHDGGESASWARRTEKVRDYGYRAHFFVATAAKAIANAFYAEPVKFSYFDGCSDGGRQAHMVAQRYPQLFEGILAGAPQMFHPDTILGIAWQSRLLYPTASRFPNNPVVPTAKLDMVATRTMAACDANDGATDGQITDPRSCQFDVGTLLCTGADGPNCLTAEQLNAVREIRRGAHVSTGLPLWAGPMPGSESLWRGLADIADSEGHGAFIGHVVRNVDNFDWRTINYDTEYSTIKNTLEPLTSAPSPDVNAFRARGGKMIQYHGWNDPKVVPSVSSSYYASIALMETGGADIDRVIDSLNPTVVANAALLVGSVQDHFRLFMVPGMSHCGGGSGPNSFNQGAGSPASAADPEHDILLSLTRWVEQGQGPQSIIATKYVNNAPASGIERQRPVCSYPTVARYNGTGDVNQAGSFSCRAPSVNELTPTAAELEQVRNSLRLRGVLIPTR